MYGQRDENNGLKAIAWILFMIAIALTAIQITRGVLTDYEYENQYQSEWVLADRASTIEAKAMHMNLFVNAIQSNSEKFAQNDAVWLKTPKNSFKDNFAALKTLNSRLAEIKTIDINSFAYQTAIQQITAQEQGEAKEMLGIFEGCYFLQNYSTLWRWIGFCLGVGILVLFIISIIMFAVAYDWN